MSARSLGQTHKVDPRGGPSATYVRTYELTKNLQDQGDSLTIRNAREKSDEIRDFSPRMNPRPEGDTMNSTDCTCESNDLTCAPCGDPERIDHWCGDCLSYAAADAEVTA